MNWTSFFAMGGYAEYVWSAYAITSVVLVWLLVNTLYHYKKTVPTKKSKKIQTCTHFVKNV